VVHPNTYDSPNSRGLNLPEIRPMILGLDHDDDVVGLRLNDGNDVACASDEKMKKY